MESLPALFAPGEQVRALRALRPIITLAPMRRMRKETLTAGAALIRQRRLLLARLPGSGRNLLKGAPESLSSCTLISGTSCSRYRGPSALKPLWEKY
jgi:hypothetical protein